MLRVISTITAATYNSNDIFVAVVHVNVYYIAGRRCRSEVSHFDSIRFI